MKDESRYVLDDLLSCWFRWMQASGDGFGHKTSAMFHDVRSGRQWDSENDVTDSSLHNAQMQTVDFCVDQLEPMHRTAINLQARNLATGYSVWTSARLPQDLEARAIVVRDARELLTGKLMAAGVM